jgi:hypothetical protein
VAHLSSVLCPSSPAPPHPHPLIACPCIRHPCYSSLYPRFRSRSRLRPSSLNCSASFSLSFSIPVSNTPTSGLAPLRTPNMALPTSRSRSMYAEPHAAVLMTPLLAHTRRYHHIVTSHIYSVLALACPSTHPPPLPEQHLLISTTTPGGLEDSMRTNSTDRVQSPGRSSPFSPSSLGFQLSSTPTNDHLYLHVTLMTIDAHGRLYDCSCYLSLSPLRIGDFKTSRLH